MKKKIKFRTEYVKTKYGWSRWVNPKMKGYLLKCCDCGLVHEFEFKTYLANSYKGERLATLLPKSFNVMFRAKRKK